MPTKTLAADTKKGAVVKANASKASAKAAAAKTAPESSKRAAEASDGALACRGRQGRDVEEGRAGDGGEGPRESGIGGAQKIATAGPGKGQGGLDKGPRQGCGPGGGRRRQGVLQRLRQGDGQAHLDGQGHGGAARARQKRQAREGGQGCRDPQAGRKAGGRRQGDKGARQGDKGAEGTKAPAKAPAKPARGLEAGPGAEVARAGGQDGQAAKTAKTAPASRTSPAGSAPADPSRPGGLGAKAAAPKRLTEGYAKDERFLLAQRAASLRERATYLEQAASLKAEAESLVEEMEPGDIQFDDESGEGGTVTVDRERDLALSAQALAAVEEIDHALAKMDNGTYGICENCGRLIPKARLEALPYARLCIDCKSGGLSRR